MEGLADYLDDVDHPAVSGMYDTFHANIEEADPIKASRDTITSAILLMISILFSIAAFADRHGCRRKRANPPKPLHMLC